jgi:hypothetical protein
MLINSKSIKYSLLRLREREKHLMEIKKKMYGKKNNRKI